MSDRNQQQIPPQLKDQPPKVAEFLLALDVVCLRYGMSISFDGELRGNFALKPYRMAHRDLLWAASSTQVDISHAQAALLNPEALPPDYRSGPSNLDPEELSSIGKLRQSEDDLDAQKSQDTYSSGEGMEEMKISLGISDSLLDGEANHSIASIVAHGDRIATTFRDSEAQSTVGKVRLSSVIQVTNRLDYIPTGLAVPYFINVPTEQLLLQWKDIIMSVWARAYADQANDPLSPLEDAKALILPQDLEKVGLVLEEGFQTSPSYEIERKQALSKGINVLHLAQSLETPRCLHGAFLWERGAVIVPKTLDPTEPNQTWARPWYQAREIASVHALAWREVQFKIVDIIGVVNEPSNP